MFVIGANMHFRSSCPTSALVQWCRALKHGLGVGLLPNRVFRQQAISGPISLRTVASRIADQLESGESLSEAFKHEVGRFPVLFVETVAVGEQSGRLENVFGELETHYTLMQTAQKRLILSLIRPGCSLCAGIFALTAMIAILGAVAPGMDPLGLHLTGTFGAVLFFAGSVVLSAGVVGLVLLIANDEALKSKALGVAMQIPGLVGCVRAFALQRFSLAWRFLAEAGMKGDRTMAASLRATANKAYRNHEESASKKIRKGCEIPEVLTQCGNMLFPSEFIEAARVGDETGQLAEVMGKQATHYQEESVRKLKVLTAVAGGLVYAFVGLLIIVAIFRIFNSTINPNNNEDLKSLEKMAGYGAIRVEPEMFPQGG